MFKIAHPVICLYCSNKFDRDKEDHVQVGRRYAHASCAQRKAENSGTEMPRVIKSGSTVVCHFCKRLLWKPYPHTENYKQWNIEEVHNILKCHAFDDDLNEYMKLKKEN